MLNFYKSISITGGVVRNLRLTEAVVNNDSQSTAFGLLAQEMNGGLVSNMTLEGEVNITSTASTDVGGLIGQIEAGEINTITNLLKVTYSNSSGTSIGGIVGHIETTANSNSDVSILYCSNYGPITGKSFARSVGGIVGSFDQVRGGAKTIINYCFNGSSVLAGYTNSDTTYNSTPYYAGGIVGFIPASTNGDIDISNCYNAGIIKAGHKDHANEAEADATQAIAYASGIVGSAAGNPVSATEGIGVYISNCYNEGSIEALGVDPTTEYVVTGVTYINGVVAEASGSKIYLVQSNTKNVSGYHIADITVTNCAKADGADLELDGAMLEAVAKDSSGKVITSGNNCNLTTSNGNGPCVYGSDDYKYMNKEVSNGDENVYFMNSFDALDKENATADTKMDSSLEMRGGNTYKWKINSIKIGLYTKGPYSQEDFSTLQQNKLKIPERFADTQALKTELKLTISGNKWAISGSASSLRQFEFINFKHNGPTDNSAPPQLDEPVDITINRNYYYDFSDQISGDEDGIITTMENALGASGSTLNEDLQLDKSSFGSSQRDVAQNYDTTIAGQSYRVAYSFDSAFESETYTGTWDCELSELGNFKDLDKLDGKESGWYIISASVGGKDVLNSLNFTVDSSGQNSVKFKYTYRGASLGVENNSSLSVKMGFRWSVSADISNDTSDYQYINDNTFAINVDGAFTISSQPEPSLDDLAIFIDSNDTLTDQAGQIHYNILKLTSADKEYYFELDTINNRLVYHIGAKLNNTRDVNQKPESTDTILDVVDAMPGKFDDLEFTQTETISDVSLNGHASFEGTVTHEKPVNIAGNTQYEISRFDDDNDLTNSIEEIEEGLWKYELVIPNCTEFFSYSETWDCGLVAVSVINPNSPMPHAVVEYNNEHLTGITAIDAGYGNSTGITLSMWTTEHNDIVFVGFSTFYRTTQAENNDKLQLINTTTPQLHCDTTGADFETDNLPTASNGFSPTYEISIDSTSLGDWNDGVITYDSFLDRNYAYFVGGVDLVYTHRLASVTYSQTDGNPVVYKKGNELAIVNNGGTITADGQDITIYQTYNGTTDRPIQAGDQIVVKYNKTYTIGPLEDEGNCTYSYSQAVFNVLFKDNQYVLEFVEGKLYAQSMKVAINAGAPVFDEKGDIVISDSSFEGSSQEEPLGEGDINTIKAAIDIYNNNGTLYIYNINKDIKISSVSRSSTVPSSTLSWVDGEINKSKQEKTVTIMGLPSNNFTSMNKSVSLSVGEESLTITTYFNNAQSQLNLYEYWEESSATGVTGNYDKPNGISYAGIILKNDIFILSDEISLSFNIYGNHHALISNQEGSMFSALGKSAGEGEGEGVGVRLENLDIVGTTSQKIFNALYGTNKFDNIDFYGTVYNSIEITAEESEADGEADDGNTGNKDTIGLYGISGTHVDIYTAIYGKKDVKIFVANMNESQTSSTTPTVQDEGSGGESQPATDDPNTHVKLKGVVFASDGKDGTSDTSATAGEDGKSITLTNTTNDMLIAVKAGDAGNGGLTLSSGLPLASDTKAGGAAGTVTGANETFSSEAGISGGVYRSDETGNSDTTFKQRAIGAVHTCTDGNGNHVKFGWNNGDRTAGPAENSDENATPEVAILIESPRSTEFSLAGVGSNFAAYYEYGADDPPSDKELLSTGGRGDFVNSADGEHLGKEAFKYLVLDANGNSVYSKQSFIDAGFVDVCKTQSEVEGVMALSDFCEQYSDKTCRVKMLSVSFTILVLKEPADFVISESNWNNFIENLSLEDFVVLGYDGQMTQEQFDGFKKSSWHAAVYLY